MDTLKMLPDSDLCRIRKSSTGLCECLVDDPVSCHYVRVDNKILYCHFHAPANNTKSMKSTDKRESRSDPGFKARIAVFSGPDLQMLLSGYSVNLSTGGLFMETADILPLDTPLKVQFKLPDYDDFVTCKARVAWVNESEQVSGFSLSPGMGLQFVDLSLNDMHLIRDYLNNGDLVPTW